MRNILNLCVLFLLLGVLAPLVSGHTIFIQSTNYWIEKGFAKPLYFGWGHHLPLDDGISGSKLKFIMVVNPNGSVHHIKLREGRSLHSYLVKYDTAGTYTLAAATNPGYYTIYLDKNRKIHHHIGPKSEIKDAERFIVSLFTHQSTKAYVVCENPSRETPPLVGFEWELKSLKNPAEIRNGDEVDFQVFRQGKPYSGSGIFWASYSGYSTGFDDYFHRENEVENGVFSIHITNPGIWYISFYVDEDPPADIAGKCNMVRFKSTLVFEVFDHNKPHNAPRTQKPKRKR